MDDNYFHEAPKFTEKYINFMHSMDAIRTFEQFSIAGASLLRKAKIDLVIELKHTVSHQDFVTEEIDIDGDTIEIERLSPEKDQFLLTEHYLETLQGVWQTAKAHHNNLAFAQIINLLEAYLSDSVFEMSFCNLEYSPKGIVSLNDLIRLFEQNDNIASVREELLHIARIKSDILSIIDNMRRNKIINITQSERNAIGRAVEIRHKITHSSANISDATLRKLSDFKHAANSNDDHLMNFCNPRFTGRYEIDDEELEIVIKIATKIANCLNNFIYENEDLNQLIKNSEVDRHFHTLSSHIGWIYEIVNTIEKIYGSPSDDIEHVIQTLIRD